jgi:hypothetical protein
MVLEDTFKIQEVIARFANSFDVKDWNGLQSCLTESLYTDYGDLRGTPPATVNAADYVKSRREALQHLNLHHLVSNYEIAYVDTMSATCRASMIVWRKTEAEEFTSHCLYTFKLAKVNSDWKISGITQKILWNEGTPSIHQAAKS